MHGDSERETQGQQQIARRDDHKILQRWNQDKIVVELWKRQPQQAGQPDEHAKHSKGQVVPPGLA